MSGPERCVARAGGVQGVLTRWAGLGAVSAGVVGALVAVMLVPAEPSAAQVQELAGQQIAAWARQAAAAPVVAAGDQPDPQEQPAPVETDTGDEVWGTGTVDPETGGRVVGGSVSVEFSGSDLRSAVNVTVSALGSEAEARATDGDSTVVLSPGFDVSAVAGDGSQVTSFPYQAPASAAAADSPALSRRTATSGELPVTQTEDGSVLIDGLPVGQAAHPEAANFDAELGESMAGDDVESVAGVRVEVEVDPAALTGISSGTVRLMTRESADEAWTVVPSYLDTERSAVVGELDHLSQFVVIGGKDTGDPRARVVLDPDNDRAFADSPGPRVTEVGYNVELANQVAARLTQTCNADVVVTRTTPIPELGRDVRAGMAYAHDPDLTVTFGFNGNDGTAWGNIGNGGSEVYSRGGPLDEQARASVLNVLPVYTGRPANPKSRANLTYSEYAGLPGAVIHLETLFLDHNFDRPVIDNGFSFIVDGVFTSLGLQLEAQGFDCSDPNRGGGWPSPPSAAQIAAWMQLGFKNYAAYGGDPVNFATGNLVELEDLFEVTGPGRSDTQVALVYNSQDGRASRFGTGWASDLTARAQRFTDGSVMVVRGDGASFVFAPDGVGGYTADVNTGARLTEAGGGQLLLSVDDGTTWRFDASHPEGVGDVVEKVAATGAVTRYEYAGLVGDPMFRQLTAVILPGDQRVIVTSDARGMVTALTAPDGRTWQLGYDDALDLRTITLPDGRVRGFDYDAAHRLTVARDSAGSVFLTNVYDDAGRVVSQGDGVGGTRTLAYRNGGVDYTDATGAVWQYEIDARSRITAATDPLGQVTRTEYGALDAPTAVVEPDGARTEYALDAKGRTTQVTGPDGFTTTLTLDDLGRIVHATEPGAVEGASLVTDVERDAAGRVTRTADLGGAIEVTEYDAAGNPVSVTDALGEVWTATFDARGNQTSATDPLGRISTFGYDAGNRLTAATTPSGATWSYAYDGAGRFVSETDPNGAVTTYAYDANDNLVSITDPTGAVTTLQWDTGRRLIAVTDPAGGLTRYRYSAEDVLVAETDPNGAITEYALDAAHRVIAITDPGGGTWRRTLDAAGRVTEQTDPDGGVSRWDYDAGGRMIVETDPDGVTTGYAYTPSGQVAELRDSAGQITTFAYDDAGLLSTATGPDGTSVVQDHDLLGRVVATTDQAGRTAMVSFDAVGQMTSETDRTGAVTEYGYDEDGNLTAATDADGVRQVTDYDGAGRVVSEGIDQRTLWFYGYDAAGRMTTQADALGAEWSYGYDQVGRLTHREDPTGAVTSYAYDAAGHQISMTDADGVVTAYGYDGAGQLSQVTQNATGTDEQSADENVATSYAYSSTGNLIKVTGPTGEVTAYAYTAGGRVRSESDPLGNTWNYGYDDAGRLATETDPDGRTTTYSYDLAGRTTTIVHTQPGIPTVTVGWEYDAIGNPIVMTDSSGTTGWTYDPEGRTTAERTTAGTLSTTHSAAGRRIAQTTPGQVTNTWTYDASGLLVQQGTSAGSIAYTYDDADQLLGITRTNSDGSPGPVSAYAYDPAGQVTSVAHRVTEVQPTAPSTDGDVITTCDTCLPGVDYLAGRTLPGAGTFGSGVWDIRIDQSYTPTGHVDTSTRTDAGATTRAGVYSYDPLGRLIGATLTDTEATATASEVPVADPDVEDELIDAAAAVTTHTYTYDATGSRTGVTTAGPDGQVSTERGIYDPAGRLTRTTTTVTADESAATSRSPVLGVGSNVSTSDFSYDRAGNRTSQTTTVPGAGLLDPATQTRSYTYGAEGLLAGISDPERTITITRDGVGRAASTTTATEFVTHTSAGVWDGLTQVAASDNTFGWTTYTRDALGDLAVQASARTGVANDRSDIQAGGVRSGSVWELTDALGSVIAQAEGDTITQVASYDPWGQANLTTTAGWDADHGYTSQTTDTGLGVVLFYARTYDPGTGQFTTTDPWEGLLTAPGTLNAYAYVLADPLTVTDVLGYWPDWNAIGGWISDHKREIAGVAAGIAVGIAVGACIAATAGVCAGVAAGVATAAGSGGLAGAGAAITIGAASGAAGGAASYAVTGNGGSYSWTGAGQAVGQGALIGGVTGGVGYGVTSGLRAIGNRITAAHQNAVANARNGSTGWGSAKPNASRPSATSARGQSPRVPSTVVSVPSAAVRVQQALTATMRNTNSMRHVFGNAGHRFGEFRSRLGGSDASILRNLLAAAVPRLNWAAKGAQSVTVTVGGVPVQVRGSVVNGVFRIGTMFVPKGF